MLTRICPICDQAMKNKHYCVNCRTWVRQPYERELNYFLNERHSDRETGCEYHGYGRMGEAAEADIYADSDINRQTAQKLARERGAQTGCQSPQAAASRRNTGGDRQAERTVCGKPEGDAGSGASGRGYAGPAQGCGPGSSAAAGGMGEAVGSSGRPVYQAPPGPPGKRGGAGQGWKMGAGIIVAVAFGLVVILAGFTSVMSAVSRALPDMMDEIYDEYSSYSDEYDYQEDEENYKVLEEEEVKAIGVRCNSFSHFNITADEVKDTIMEAVRLSGYRVADESLYSYNEVGVEGNEEWTYYSSYHTFYITGQNDMTFGEEHSQWVELDGDTATDELHSYSSQLEDGTKSMMLMTEFIRSVETAYGIPETESCIPQISREIQSQLETNGYYYYESELFYITGHQYEDGLYLQVSCNDEDG